MASKVARDRAFSLIVVAMVSIATILIYAYLQGPGHNWGDDFGLYLQYAQNITDGRSLNELNFGIQVPPGFPFIIALTSHLHHWDFPHMKTIGSASVGLIGVFAFFISQKYVSAWTSLLIMTASMWNGYVFVLQKDILADVPFSAATTLCLLVAVSLVWREAVDRCLIILVVVLPLSVLAALLIKPAGMTLFVAVVLSIIFRILFLRDSRTKIAVAISLALVLAGAIYYYLSWAASTSGFLSIVVAYIAAAPSLLSGVTSLMETGLPREVSNLSNLLLWFGASEALCLTIMALALGSAIATLVRHRGAAPIEWFMLGQFGLLVMTPWSGGGPRYLLPLLPLVLLHFAKAAEISIKEIFRLKPEFAAKFGAVVSAFVMAIMSIHGMEIVYQNRLYNENDIDHPEVAQMIGWIKQNTAPESVICSFKPRAIMYLAHRRTCYSGDWDAVQSAEEFLISQKANYFVSMTKTNVNRTLSAFERFQTDKSLCEVFQNSDYIVYEVCGSRQGSLPGQQ